LNTKNLEKKTPFASFCEFFRLVGNTGYRRYLKVQRDNHFAINEEQIRVEWRKAARRASCQDAITLLHKQIEAKPFCQGTPTNILAYRSIVQTAAA
jgi:hypothetical protein